MASGGVREPLLYYRLNQQLMGPCIFALNPLFILLTLTISEKRLSLTEHGQVRYSLKNPWGECAISGLRCMAVVRSVGREGKSGSFTEVHHVDPQMRQKGKFRKSMKYARMRAIFTENDTHAGKISENQVGVPTKEPSIARPQAGWEEHALQCVEP